MKKENLEILQRIQPAIEKIIASECENIYEEYQENKTLLYQKDQEIKKLEKVKNELEKSKNGRENYALRLRQVVDLVAGDGVIEIIQDGDNRSDEYGNGGGYRVEFAKYKDEQIELQYDSF